MYIWQGINILTILKLQELNIKSPITQSMNENKLDSSKKKMGEIKMASKYMEKNV